MTRRVRSFGVVLGANLTAWRRVGGAAVQGAFRVTLDGLTFFSPKGGERVRDEEQRESEDRGGVMGGLGVAGA